MENILEIKNLNGGYKNAPILFDININIQKSNAIAITGRNGVGKSTLLKTIMGIEKSFSGEIILNTKNITNLKSYQRANLGIGWVPEGRNIFHNLSVQENLIVTQKEGYWDLEKIFSLFPRLKEKLNNKGNKLSGGEQQILSISRALLTNPKLLILDEATEGLAPIIRKEIWEVLNELQNKLTLIIVDKNLTELSKVVKNFFVMEKGQVVYEGDDIDEVHKQIAL